jgi:hypothetical protein
MYISNREGIIAKHIRAYIFFNVTGLRIFIVKSSADNPTISPILAIFDPIAFPTAIFVLLPNQAASIPTKISGADVAKPTIINPVTNGDILYLRAVFAVASTKK